MTPTRLLITSVIASLLACTAAHAKQTTPALAAPVQASVSAGAAAADSVEALLARVGNISEGW